MSVEATRDAKPVTAPLRPVKLGPPDVQIERKPDGTIYLRSPHPLGPYPDKLTQRLEHWAQAAPDRVFLAHRAPDSSWRTLTYAQMLAQVRAVAQALLQRDLSTERPIGILSGNDLEHDQLGIDGMMIGVPYEQMSVPY
jgi:feruloyl-CoA synthase